MLPRPMNLEAPLNRRHRRRCRPWCAYAPAREECSTAVVAQPAVGDVFCYRPDDARRICARRGEASNSSPTRLAITLVAQSKQALGGFRMA